jgi:2,5-diamino-6-(ribosylamino)-4(3H)-pyrimidinone 5'-phosphate reductase
MDWLAVDMGLFYQFVPCWKEEATLVGSHTLLQAPLEDEGSETESFEKNPDDPRPLLVVPDSKGRVRNLHVWRKQPYWRDVVALCSRATPQDYFDYLQQQRIESIVAGEDHVDLRTALEELNERYAISIVRADCGGTLNGILLREGLVHEVSVLIHPYLVGGTTAQSIFLAPDLTSSDDVIPLKLIHVEQVQEHLLWLRYEVMK